MDSNDLKRAEQLGIEGVRLEMARGGWGQPGSQVREETEHWLKMKEAERSLASEAKHDAREEETIAIAREANDIAREAKKWAMYAAIAAVIALIISIVNNKP